MTTDRQLTKERMKAALARLDQLLSRQVKLIVGGGGAMVMAYGFPLATMDIDAYPKGMDLSEIDPILKQVARELDIAPDWLNPWFSSFAHVLPKDFESRLVPLFQGKQLTAEALGREDLLIMKCFAHRPKDVGHSKALIKSGANLKFVRQHLEKMDEAGLPQAPKALDFLDDLEDQL